MKLNKNTFALLLTLLMVSMLSACSQITQGASQNKKTIRNANGQTAEQLLSKARLASKAGNYPQAIEYYETLEAHYPLGRLAQQALLETAFAYYKSEEEDTALDTIDRFKRMYPSSPIMDYALYLRGLINFNRGKGLMDKIFPKSFSDLDNVRQKEAFHDFSNLVNRYPKSRYAKDASQRLQHLQNSLATSEINVARYYMQRGAYVAAMNRTEYTIKHYQGSPAIIDALKLKIKIAHALKKPEIARAAFKVLQLNFPQEAAKIKQP
ncbi:MAG: outer membrane protein assembly factor BamD [Thiotrichaceae bacterium]|nr:outer membrane protein assembly factor BamD [Thiotrichaceae bacterium]